MRRNMPLHMHAAIIASLTTCEKDKEGHLRLSLRSGTMCVYELTRLAEGQLSIKGSLVFIEWNFIFIQRNSDSIE